MYGNRVFCCLFGLRAAATSFNHDDAASPQITGPFDESMAVRGDNIGQFFNEPFCFDRHCENDDDVTWRNSFSDLPLLPRAGISLWVCIWHSIYSTQDNGQRILSRGGSVGYQL